MFDQFKTEPPAPSRDLGELQRWSETRGRQLRRQKRLVRGGAIGVVGCCAAGAAFAVVAAVSAGPARPNLAVGAGPATTPTTAATPQSLACTTGDAKAQRSSQMPVPQRAGAPVQLNASGSPALLPAPAGATPAVTASVAWAAAGLPRSGGGEAAIVFGVDPTATPGSTVASTPVWLVYAKDVALTNGYPDGGPPLYGVKGPCQFGWVAVVVDATTGKVLEQGGGLY